MTISLYMLLFSGFWEFQFNEQSTKPQDFRLAPGKTKAVPMMNTEQDFKTAISDQLKCRAIDIPYRGSDLSMVVILPLQDFGLKVHLFTAPIDMKTC